MLSAKGVWCTEAVECIFRQWLEIGKYRHSVSEYPSSEELLRLIGN